MVFDIQSWLVLSSQSSAHGQTPPILLLLILLSVLCLYLLLYLVLVPKKRSGAPNAGECPGQGQDETTQTLETRSAPESIIRAS